MKLTKTQMCIVLRNNIQIWIDKEKATKFQQVLQNITSSKFIQLDDQTINTADITGIFNSQTLEEYTRLKRGQWKDKKGKWYGKNEHPINIEVPSYARGWQERI